MAHSEDHIALAAEYALGTLDAGERAQAETMMEADAEFASLVRSWEWRLGALNQMVGLVEPRPIVWENIRRAIASSAPQETLAPPEAQPAPSAEAPLPEAAAPSPEPVAILPESAAPESAAPTPGAGVPAPDESMLVVPSTPEPPEMSAPAAPVAEAVAPVPPVVDQTNVIRLTTEARRWRGVARVVSALAAALVAMLGLQIFAPDYLPDVLRPSPRTRIVQVKTPVTPPTPAAQYVALLQGQDGGPAFILTVDGATKSFTVRKVGATAPDAGKAYELWLISDKLGRPRSLGVIGGGDFTARAVLSSYDADIINNATYAVTVEQAGGSPDGNPHSAPVYSGKLIETVPPLVPAPQPQKR
jgi:anti-sigma-K factor RskA